MITLDEHIEKLLILQANGYGKFPIIYSEDDEGNHYNKVIYEPSLAQIHNLEDYCLELVGFKGGESIDDKDLNVVIIN